MSEDIDNLKKLSPEERLKKLKDFSEKREKEIKEAQDLIKKSEDEINRKKKFEEKIPIPQLITDEGETLATSEEREMFKVHRFKGEKTEEKKTKRHVEETLEETVEQAPARSAAPAVQYVQEASMRPIHELYSELTAIYERAHEMGYITREDMAQVGLTYAAVMQKEESGYTAPEREKEALTERISRLQGMYKSQPKDKERQHHAYSFERN
ncbi:hypothetical protein HY497_02360 [Candidatus Woesearchaeota archaeon]|nr:hypothetical protein [Candidatus Woesearchaeota archaeon]